MISSTNRLFVGRSTWTADTHHRIEQAAPYRANVLIQGPSGTGKELVARALHTQSSRAEAPFVPVNCAAIPHTLFDSQMFGHRKGAFTGAEYESLGCFRAAEGGTLFLDEIGELDLDLQAKLLRVLQDREVTPVGTHQPVKINVRIVAATNRDLLQEVEAGRFRLDLYYRLNVIEIPTLALQDRVEDIRPLAEHMLHKACAENGLAPKTLSQPAIRLLEQQDWPGNVRELQNLIERTALATRHDRIEPAALEALTNHAELDAAIESVAIHSTASDDSQANGAPAAESEQPRADDWQTLEDIEQAHIERTLAETFYNQSAAARLLGIDRKRLARKISKYDLRIAQLTSSFSRRAAT